MDIIIIWAITGEENVSCVPFLRGGWLFLLSYFEHVKKYRGSQASEGNHSQGTGKIAQVLRVLFHEATELN